MKSMIRLREGDVGHFAQVRFDEGAVLGESFVIVHEAGHIGLDGEAQEAQFHAGGFLGDGLLQHGLALVEGGELGEGVHQVNAPGHGEGGHVAFEHRPLQILLAQAGLQAIAEVFIFEGIAHVGAQIGHEVRIVLRAHWSQAQEQGSAPGSSERIASVYVWGQW
ncbi:MAG: hypothetical protein IPG69_14485 [Flavobacteriales bacterium]|nr:hypothetical protein [Flavobacteriales bacterium]